MSEKTSEKRVRSNASRDPELAAIARIGRVLDALGPAQRRRVLLFVAERYAALDPTMHYHPVPAAEQKPGEPCKFPGLG